MKVVNWGIIGCGKVVEEKSGPAFNRVDNSSIYAVMRRNIDDAKKSSEKLGAVKYYDDVDDLLNDSNVNAVYIATPPGLHFEQAKKCCEAGKITYIEKPMARNYDEALKIVEMFKEADIPLFVAHYRRAMPKFIEIKKIIDSGEIGRICEVDFRLNRKYNSDEINNSWLYNLKMSGGGKFFDIAPHTIDILVFLFGKFSDIYSFAMNNNSDYEVEDVVTMMFKTESGVVGCANFNSIALEKSDKMIIYGTNGKIEFSIHGNNNVKITTSDNVVELTFDNNGVIQENMIKNVVDCIINNDSVSNVCIGDDALETYRIIDRVLDDYYKGRGRDFWND